mgnify:CR=1 FL=1
MLQSLKHLSQVDKMKQVEPMSYALFPGYHCPLMGAMLTIRAIKDSVMLVLGQMSVLLYKNGNFWKWKHVGGWLSDRVCCTRAA